MSVPTTLLRRAFWPLVGLSALYIFVLLLLAQPFLQTHAIYMHLLQTTWFHDLTHPEEFGFAKNQVAPFYIPTPDGEKLFAWHVLPLGLYAEHRDVLLDHDSGLVENITKSAGFKLLREDPEARLIISFHGNTGTVGSLYRPIYYRSLSAASPHHIHVLTFDYRGFGYSTGFPSETGLTTDGLAAFHWAVNVAGIPPSRIALLGQSLGTAVTFSVAEALSNPADPTNTPPITDLAAVISLAGFSNLKELVKTYHVAGVLPILAPLNPYPLVQRFFTSFVRETWESARRVDSLVRHSENLKLYIIHAANDNEIPWVHSEYLFHAAANATTSGTENAAGLSMLDVQTQRKTQDLGAEGYVNSWPAAMAGARTIEQWVVNWGEHNRIVTSASVSLLVARALGL